MDSSFVMNFFIHELKVIFYFLLISLSVIYLLTPYGTSFYLYWRLKRKKVLKNQYLLFDCQVESFCAKWHYSPVSFFLIQEKNIVPKGSYFLVPRIFSPTEVYLTEDFFNKMTKKELEKIFSQVGKKNFFISFALFWPNIMICYFLMFTRFIFSFFKMKRSFSSSMINFVIFFTVLPYLMVFNFLKKDQKVYSDMVKIFDSHLSLDIKLLPLFYLL